ncbi:MAG: NAD-glutamate dehydrogenase [Proteobacteria bacterium]|nr:NAD-glutamate dehydrogenase [Pseudomonadota bacterium]
MQSLLTKDHKKMINQVSAKLTKLDSPYTKSAKQLVKQLFTQMSVSEIQLHNESYWAAVVINMIDSMSSRRLKNPIIEVFNPDEEKHGFASTESTVIQLVNDNIPFIVDSVSMACARYDLNIKLISHPIIHIEETDGQRYITKKSLSTKLNLKSIIYIEVTQVSSKKIKSFKQALVKVISQIRLVVSDWKEMTDQMELAVKALGSKGDDESRASQQEFLQWLLNNHFTFLASRKYKINKSCLIAAEYTG